MTFGYNDACCFTGSWPFRKIHKGKMSDIMSAHKKHGITGGLVGCLNSVFYNDPYEGDEEVAKLIKDCGYRFAATVNPLLPGTLEELDNIKNVLGADAIRLYPSNHSYACNCDEVKAVAKRAGELGLKVVITIITEDIRLDYCFKQTPVNCRLIPELLDACPDTKFLISCIKPGEIFVIADALNAHENVWVDTARFSHEFMALDSVTKRLSHKKIVFGSGAPLLSMRCMLLNAECTDLDDDIIEMIMRSNFEDFIS